MILQIRVLSFDPHDQGVGKSRTIADRAVFALLLSSDGAPVELDIRKPDVGYLDTLARYGGHLPEQVIDIPGDHRFLTGQMILPASM